MNHGNSPTTLHRPQRALAAIVASLALSSAVRAEDSAGPEVAVEATPGYRYAATAESVDAAQSVIAPDQPGVAFSSQTVGAWRFELDSSVQRDFGHTDYRALSLPTLLRYGLSENLEVRLASAAYMVYDGPDGSRICGWNDVNLGLKYHVASSAADGAPSLGILLNAALDTGARAFRGFGVRPSVAVSAEWNLPGGYGLAVSPGLVVDNAGNGRYLGGVFAAALGHDVGETGHITAELAAPRIAPAADGGNQYAFDLGYTVRVGNDTQLDVAANFGLNKHTPDAQVAFGISHRW